MALGLHRCDDVYLPTLCSSWPVNTEDPAVVVTLNQRRKDLFWALYSIDRLTIFVINQPVSIQEADIDVDVSESITT
jgi:hypothetical protein